jgi:basic amino acid/polyamine antiporter, APA family
MGNMIGSGVFLLPASLAPYGGISLIGWLVSTVGAVFLALVFARLASFHPASGGPYAYTRQAYGDLAGFLVAWGYLISVWATNAALAVAFVGYLGAVVPTAVSSPAVSAFIAVGLVWLLTAVNVSGVRPAARVQLVTTVLKIAPLIVIGIAGTLWLQPSHFALKASASGFGKDLMATATLTLFALLGLECATIPAGETADARRTIPRATITGTLLTAIIYVVSTIGVMSLLDPAVLGQSPAPFADAARSLAGNTAAALVALGAATSCFGALNGWVLISGQIPMAVAQDGLLPAFFGRLSGRGTPANAMIVGSAFATGLVAMNYSRSLVEIFTFIILLATLSSLVPFAFCSLAGFILRRRDPRLPWSSGTTIVSLVAFAFTLFTIAGAGPDVVFYGFLLLLAGLPLYVWVAKV